jgi:hypothetical protein
LAAIRALLKGYTVPQASDLFGRCERVVRLWIEMFNAEGPLPFARRRGAAARAKVKLGKLRDLLVPVLEDPAQAKQPRRGRGIGRLVDGRAGAGPERQDEAERATYLKSLQAFRKDPQVELL